MLETELNVELDKSRCHPKMTKKCLGIGTPKTLNFPFVPNGKLMVLGVPIFKHFRVLAIQGKINIYLASASSRQHINTAV